MSSFFRYLFISIFVLCLMPGVSFSAEANENQEAGAALNNALQEYTGQNLQQFLESTPIPMLEGESDQATDPGDSPFYTYDDEIVILGYNGIEMPANVFIPTTPMPADGYPAVILPHGWGGNEHNYSDQAKHFAEKGYIIMRYTSRGWATKRNGAEENFITGLINTVGPEDMADLGHVLDWMEENTPVDSANIGMTGISYGSIMSLNGASRHDRIKTAAALDGPTNVEASFWAGETPHAAWMASLLAAGVVKGDMDPLLPQHFVTLLSYGHGQGKGIPELKEWSAVRSPLTYIDDINDSGKPIYMNCLWHDNMFQAGQHFNYYKQLTVPKKMAIRQGVHGSVPGDIWEEVYDWMDYWLKNEENGIMSGDMFSMTIKNTSEIVTYDDLPAERVSQKKYYLEWRAPWELCGSLQTGKYEPWWPVTNSYESRPLGTLATTGIPILSALLDSLDIFDVYAELPLMSKTNGIYYQTGKLENGLKLRGRVNLTIRAKSSRPQAAYFAYLYDVNEFGLGTLITHGAFSDHEAPANTYHWVDVDLVPASWDLPAGHRLAIAIDTQDPLYTQPTLDNYSINIQLSNKKHSYLELDIEE